MLCVKSCVFSFCAHLQYFITWSIRDIAPGCNYSSLSMAFWVGVTLVSSVPSGLSVTSVLRQGYSRISSDSPLSNPEDGSTQVHSSHIWDIAVMDISTWEDGPLWDCIIIILWSSAKSSCLLAWPCSTFPFFYFVFSPAFASWEVRKFCNAVIVFA